MSVDALVSLVGGDQARHSGPGLILAALSLLVMPFLSYGQRRTGRELNSLSAVADSRQTLLCTYLSAVLLVGLALNSLFGWSFADPVAALVIAVVAVKEGREAWKGDTCCAPNAAMHTSQHEEHAHSAVDACCATIATVDAQVSAGCGDGCDCCAPTTKTDMLTLTTKPRRSA